MSNPSTIGPVSKKSILYGTLTASATALLGGALITAGNSTAPYGWSMFIALPAVTGFVAGCFGRFLWAALLTTLLSLVVCFVGLLFTGLEGLVCILMASPLIVAGALVGTFLGWLVRQAIDSQINLVLIPFLGLPSVFAAGQVEERSHGVDRVETVVSTCIVSGSPEEAWDTIVRVEDISAQRPFLRAGRESLARRRSRASFGPVGTGTNSRRWASRRNMVICLTPCL